ncbi:glycosyltransferase [Candidatus Uhrbacteria bacterium]|nr:glycosyltransferase [Candidatus Uhrbacteria bacterium]
MKIGFFSNLYPPFERGGAELIAQRVADEFSLRGHDVFVVTTKPFSGMKSLRPTVIEHYVERVFRFFPLNLYHLLNAHRYPFFLRLIWHLIDLFGPLQSSVLGRLLKDEAPDVIFTHNLKGFGMSAGLQIQKMGIRHIHTIHDVQLSIPSGVLIYGNEKRESLMRRLYERATKRAIGSPDIVISPSEFLSHFYRLRGFFENSNTIRPDSICNTRVIPNPTPKYVSRTERETTPPSGSIRFLFVGQVEPHKGIDILLSAVSQISFPFELHIAGDGTSAKRVVEKSKTDPRIVFHGFISLEHIRRLMRECDVVVLPSFCYENSPTVIYESFQVGTPVIASKIGGIPELVKDGENGLLVEPANVGELARALTRFSQERELFWSKTKEIQNSAERFSIKKYVDELEGIVVGSK